VELAYQESQVLIKPQKDVITERLFVLGILFSIAICEWIFAFKNVSYGIVLALFLAVAIYLILSIFKLSPAAELSAEALALVPLYILFTSSLPWFFLAQQLRLPAVYIIVLVLAAWHIYQKGIDLNEMGLKKEKFRRWAGWVALGILMGIPAGVTEFYAIVIEPSFPQFHLTYFFRDLIYMIFFVGLGEEVLFRGLIQTSLISLLGRWWGIFLAAALFAVMHLTWRSNLELVFTFCVGLIFGIFYDKTRSLVGPIIMHGVGNTVLVSVMPYLRH